MNCAYCSIEFHGRRRTYCEPSCRKRAYESARKVRPLTASNVCSELDCQRVIYALKICRLHYKRSRPRTPDTPVQSTCIVCGTSVVRMPRATKHGHTCSNLCKKIITFGVGATCEIPKDHMARNYGKTCRWYPPKPKPLPAVERTFNCEWCGTKKTTLSPEARFCTRVCKHKSNGARRRAAEFNAVGAYTWQQIVQLWSTFDQCCAYCQTPTPLTGIQAEHVHPLSKQGRNDIGNLLPSCSACNSDKRDLLLVDWNPDRLRRGLTPVATTWDTKDTRYAHLVPHHSNLRLAA